MKTSAALALLLAALPVPVSAGPGTPGAAWFSGSYDRVGRDGAGKLLDDRVGILPLGTGLEITRCGGRDSVLSFGPAFEIDNLLTGQRGSSDLACLFHNNGYSRPILTCRAADGAAFTLWPVGTYLPPSC